MNPKDLVGSKKAPLGLVPPALEIGAAEAMENGAVKYGPFNWREQPIEFMSYLVAMKRHIAALIDGQDLAEDTGIHHLKHVAAGAGILLDAMGIEGGLIDNRPPVGPAADMLRAMDRSASHAAAPAPGRVENITVTEFAEATLSEYLGRLERPVLTQIPVVHEITSEEWGIGDGPILGRVDWRGEWPPDTFVAGRLTCCGQTEHALDCPQWR